MNNYKVAVILGAGPGLGLSLAKKFSAEGYRIALVSRTRQKLANLKKKDKWRCISLCCRCNERKRYQTGF